MIQMNLKVLFCVFHREPRELTAWSIFILFILLSSFSGWLSVIVAVK